MLRCNDYKCPDCKALKKDEYTKKGDVVTCKCGSKMDKCVSAPNIGGMDNLGRSGSSKLPDI